MKHHNKHAKGKQADGDEEEDDAIKCRTRKGSDKVSDCKEPSADTLDLFTLSDFLDDDEEDDDFEPPVRKRGKRKAVPLKEDDDDNDENEEEDGAKKEIDDDEDDDIEDEDEDYKVDDDEGDDDEQDEDEEEDDEEITLRTGKAEQGKQKKIVVRSKDADVDVIIGERRVAGQRSTNVDQATEFLKYIHDLMKMFKEHVRKGKQVKKHLQEMIDDVREVCANMRYLGKDFSLEEIVLTFSDPSFKAWQAKLSG